MKLSLGCCKIFFPRRRKDLDAEQSTERAKPSTNNNRSQSREAIGILLTRHEERNKPTPSPTAPTTENVDKASDTSQDFPPPAVIPATLNNSSAGTFVPSSNPTPTPNPDQDQIGLSGGADDTQGSSSWADTVIPAIQNPARHAYEQATKGSSGRIEDVGEFWREEARFWRNLVSA